MMKNPRIPLLLASVIALPLQTHAASLFEVNNTLMEFEEIYTEQGTHPMFPGAEPRITVGNAMDGSDLVLRRLGLTGDINWRMPFDGQGFIQLSTNTVAAQSTERAGEAGISFKRDIDFPIGDEDEFSFGGIDYINNGPYPSASQWTVVYEGYLDGVKIVEQSNSDIPNSDLAVLTNSNGNSLLDPLFGRVDEVRVRLLDDGSPDSGLFNNIAGDSGLIFGNVNFSDPIVVPEPSNLFLLSLSGLIFMRRQR